jgi:hypothetical protein
MIRKPTSGDSDQREREAERARRHSEISPAGGKHERTDNQEPEDRQPAHGGSEGESAHGAIPRRGIDSDHES